MADLPKGLIGAALVTVGLPGFALVSLVGVEIPVRLIFSQDEHPPRTAVPSSYHQPSEKESVEYVPPRARTQTKAKQKPSRSASKTLRDNTPQLIESELSAARHAEQEAGDFRRKAERAQKCDENKSQRASIVQWKLENKKHWKKVREKKLNKKQSKAEQCSKEASYYAAKAQEAEARAAQHRQNARELRRE